MATIHCKFLDIQSEALDRPPWPGELGKRLQQEISAAAWQQWQQRLVMIINEYQLNSANPEHQALIEKHMQGFLFKEGEYGQMPAGFNPANPASQPA